MNAPTREDEPQAGTRVAPTPWVLDLHPFAPPDVPDGLRFLGWSDDGRRFAFEVWHDGRATGCGDKGWIRVVDAREDRFVGKADVAFQTYDEQACLRKELRARLDVQRGRLLDKHGITRSPEAPAEPIRQGKTDSFEVASPAGPLRFLFEERFITDDPYGREAERGAAFRLTLTAGRDLLVIEPGTRRRRGVLGYRLEPSFVFFGPHGHAAILLIRMNRDFEGVQWSWMANGFVLPKAEGQLERSPARPER